MTTPPPSPGASLAPETPLVSPGAAPAARRSPTRWQSIGLFVRTDLGSMLRSWLCRGFLLATVLVTVIELKGMQAHQQPASQMLETVYVTYLLVWMHGIIFIAGSALMREADCLNDAILSRGVTRGEFILGKILSRCLAIALIVLGVLLPVSLWAIRQDKLVRNDDGFVTSAARNTKVEAWDPRKVFTEVGGTVKTMTLKTGDAVRVGDVLAMLDDRTIFDELETERRTEENARNEVNNTRRRVEEARRNVAAAEDALEKAERSLIAKDLLSKAEQADRQTDIRSRKRDLKNAESQLRLADGAGLFQRGTGVRVARFQVACLFPEPQPVCQRLARFPPRSPGFGRQLPAQTFAPLLHCGAQPDRALVRHAHVDGHL